MNRLGLTLGIALVLVSNAIALIGVAWNRRGTPFQTIELTERELHLVARDEDDSSISVRLAWEPRFPSFRRPLTADQGTFDAAKLQALGFHCPDPADTRETRPAPLPCLLFVALEFDGTVRGEWLNESEREGKQEILEPENGQPSRPSGRNPAGNLSEGTRLFVVDASRSLEELQSRYPDRRRHLIVRGVVRARLRKDPDQGSGEPSHWVGSVADVIPAEIHVPQPFSPLFAKLPKNASNLPRYRVILHYGRNLEPWVADVQLSSR